MVTLTDQFINLLANQAKFAHSAQHMYQYHWNLMKMLKVVTDKKKTQMKTVK